jgi:hypothetical protein
MTVPTEGLGGVTTGAVGITGIGIGRMPVDKIDGMKTRPGRCLVAVTAVGLAVAGGTVEEPASRGGAVVPLESGVVGGRPDCCKSYPARIAGPRIGEEFDPR